MSAIKIWVFLKTKLETRSGEHVFNLGSHEGRSKISEVNRKTQGKEALAS